MKNILIILLMETWLNADLILAEVTTPSGTYNLGVEVDGNIVRCVQLGNGGYLC